ncbi:EamA/RhaT family transporter [Sulfitobacter sp. SK012]|uniref:DMT family transporter n=1 Tax=Sulfitobacter sp. SK012 TaxID=1389005 RepID=UPI000E0AA38A|nr:DMT family transporter [Sulfitobacter sp. SK012]AXI47150.1 EamA/RhaT family transporter [Sulfitobacter sp. SK012]
MSALTLGLIAAFCWGLHDVLVRRVSQNTPLMASLLVVLVAGTLFQMGLMVSTGGFASVSLKSAGLATASGIFFLIASLGLYGAFQRGPVRLVAPIIASYPILSVAWAAASGVSISTLEWLAVLAIIAGVSVVAALADDGETEVPAKGRTVIYAVIAACGFAGTFALGQMATSMDHDLPIVLITRLVAIALLVGLMIARTLPFNPGRRAMPVLVLMGCLDGIALICVLSAGGLPDAQYAAVASSVFGLLTIVMAWAFLKERMTPTQWGGCLLTFAAIGYLAL